MDERELEAKHPRWFRHMVSMIQRFVPEIGKRPKRNVKPKRRRRRARKRRAGRKKKKSLMDMMLADFQSNVAPAGYQRLGGGRVAPARIDQTTPGPWAELGM
jgi:hypothetical protein